jgi:hypothetical protein
MKKFIYTVLLLEATFSFQHKVSAQVLKNSATTGGLSDYTFYNIEFADNNTGMIGVC